MCMNDVESMEHVLFNYERAQKVWKGLIPL